PARRQAGRLQAGGDAAQAPDDDEHIASDLGRPGIQGGGGRPGQLMVSEIDVSSMCSAIPWRPPSRPSPLSLKPPNGISCVYPVASLTQTSPYSRASLVRITRLRSREDR